MSNNKLFEKPEKEKIIMSAITISKLKPGTRILLNDGRIGKLIELNGNSFTAKTMNIELNNEKVEASVLDFKSDLCSKENLCCPICQSKLITEGFLREENGTTINYVKEPTGYGSTVKVHKCLDCRYLMLFA